MQLFFGKNKPKANSKDAIVSLRETLQMLEKRENFLQSKIDSEVKIAREHAATNKRAALMALKRKKQYENQIEKISGARMLIESQVMTIEHANVNAETVKALEKGAEALKAMHTSMDINKVDDTMDSIRENMDLAEEISNAISAPLHIGVDLDDEELAQELELLEQEALDKQLLGAEAPPVTAPNVPRTEPVVIEDAEEEEQLAELRAAFA